MAPSAPLLSLPVLLSEQNAIIDGMLDLIAALLQIPECTTTILPDLARTLDSLVQNHVTIREAILRELYRAPPAGPPLRLEALTRMLN